MTETIKRTFEEMKAVYQDELAKMRAAVDLQTQTLILETLEPAKPAVLAQRLSLYEYEQSAYSNSNPSANDLRSMIGEESYREILQKVTETFQSQTYVAGAYGTAAVPVPNIEKLTLTLLLVFARLLDRAMRRDGPLRLRDTMMEIAESAVRSNRHRYTIGLFPTAEQRGVPFSERAHPVVRLKGPNKEEIRVRFTPDPNITALELYRCQQILDGYVPLDQRLAFLFDNDIAQHFTEHT